MRDAVEQTVVVTMDIPGDGDWRWMPEMNVLVLAAHLDELGRRRAIDEAQATWRDNWLAVIA